MKKLIAMLLVLAMVLSFAGCAKKDAGMSHADYVACHKSAYVNQYDILGGIKEGGVFVRVSGAAPVSAAAEALQACRDAGFQRVSYVPAN